MIITVYYIVSLVLLVYDFIVEFIGYACLCIISVVLRFFRTLPKIRNKDGITYGITTTS